MPIITASIDAFIYTSLALLIPLTLYLRGRHQTPPDSTTNRDAPFISFFDALVIAHTLWVLYVLIVLPPPNIFRMLGLSLTAPADVIRNVLLQSAGLGTEAGLPQTLEDLLTRLSSFDMRGLYVRFGQKVLQDCTYCLSYDDYALSALCAPLLDYLQEIIVVGLLTMEGSGKERWRVPGTIAIVGAALVEGYSAHTAEIEIPRDGLGVTMLHDTLWFYRHLLFLILPLTIHLLLPSLSPSQPLPDPRTLLVRTEAALRATTERLAALRFLREAIMRDPALRESASGWWEEQRVRGEWVREDEEVRRLAEKLGLGFTNERGGEEGERGNLKENARRSVDEINKMLVIKGSR